jgi:Carboxypeptidase regulatory-like domain/TonB dependent receptor-like, beta-barrel
MKKDVSFVQWWKILSFGIFALLLLTAQLYAQVDTGTIMGTVKDQTGAVIPNATVTLTNPATSYTITKKSGPDGSYVFTPVRIGNYSVTAEDPGFQKTTQTGIAVNIQQQVVVNLTMVPGRVTQTVQVTGAVPMLQTQNASVQQVVTSQEINDLPLNGRNASFLAQLSAGVTPNHDAGRGLTQSGSFSANGAHSLQNNYMVDGMDDNAEIGDLIDRTQYVVLPPPDALDQFTVQSNNYNAEFGHSAGAVLNATTKSGTNRLHGDLWEFVRNDKFDATDFFLNAAGAQKAEYRQNQFGFTLGGPVVIPHLYNGRNKTFFFGYYEGTRIRQGSTGVSSVPTAAERASGYTDFQDLIAGQSGKRTDLLGRTFPLGTIMDPATTRPVTSGQADTVTGIVATANGYVRDPFYQGSLVGVTDFTTSANVALLNMIPAGRLDSNAIKLLNLYPSPTSSGLVGNYTSAPVNLDDNDQYGIRVDQDFSEKDTMFVRYILSNTTNNFPGPFPGLADGQPNRPGSGTTKAQNWALSETHIFSSSLVNEARIGYSRLHDVRLQLNGNTTTDVPSQFGIQGIPQVAENGGLPRFTTGGLTDIGTAQFLPSDKWSNTLQATENLTKITGHHTTKTGFEFQNIRYPMLTPPNSRGQFYFNGVFTSVVNQTDGSTGRAQFLLTPTASTVPGGIDNVGGMNQLVASNIAPYADLRRNYYGLYAQDDWRLTPKVTLNFGLRWDYYGKANEHFNAQSNFIEGPNFQGGTMLFPASLAGQVPQAYIDQLGLDGIKFTTSSGPIWGQAPKKDFGPRFGFAYHPMSKLVARGGYAIFYGGFETFGLSAYGNGNFPFQVKSNFVNPNATTPITPDNSIGLLENGLLNVPLTAASTTNLSGLALEGEQYNWKDTSTQNYNLFLEYELARQTTLKAGYVGSQSRHLMFETSANTVATILPPGTKLQPHLFYPDFGSGGTLNLAWGNSNYNGLQVNLEHRTGNLYLLSNFTWAKCRANTSENLTGGSNGQAPYLAGFGPQYTLCVDGGSPRIFHLSGVYDLPFGHGKRFLNNSGVADAVLGGWSTNWIFAVQDGEPFTIGCNVSTTTGLGCNALMVPGQNPYQGSQTPAHFVNAAAFANPPVATTIGQTDYAPLGGAGTQVAGPPYRDLDFSLFKNIKTTENTHLQFRAEFFNLTNTPSFSTPSSTNFSDTKNFGKITSTISNPREIQFALKFFF